MIRRVLLLSLFCLSSGSGLTAADGPEPLPSYSSARLLREDASLHAVAFRSSTTGIAVGDRGTVLRTDDGGESWHSQDSGVDCRLDDAVWLDSQTAVVVGGGYDRVTQISRGAILVSTDGGRRWNRTADEELPRLRDLRLREDRSLVALGDWSYAAQTRQFVSHDRGRTWKSSGELDGPVTISDPPNSSELFHWARATRLPVAIRDACRIDDHHLCAVGDHGVITVSRDNGKSWQTRRGQKRQTAVLVVAADASQVPWALVGNEALESRNRVSVLLAHAARSSSRSPTGPETPALDLACQAAVMLGGSGADEVLGQGTDHARTAGQWIAVMKPVAVVLDDSLSQPVQDAFFQAATAAGVSRIALCSCGAARSTTLHRDALLTKTGVLASDLASDALQLLAPAHREVQLISLRYVYDIAASRRGDSITSGLPLHAGYSLTDRPAPASRRQLQMVQARMKQSIRVEQLIGTSRTTIQFAQSLSDMLDQTAKEDQFRLAWVILQSLDPASEMQLPALAEISERFADTSAGRWASLRRGAITHSLEWKRLRPGGRTGTLRNASFASTSPLSVAVSPFQVETGVQQASAIAPLVVPKPEMLDFHRSPRKKQTEVDLTWEFHPAVLIAGEAARHRGDLDELQVADGQSANLRRLIDSRGNAWSRLLSPRSAEVVHAYPARTPPRLDGVLDDPCWRSAIASAGQSPRLRLAYDDDYVYVSIQCRSAMIAPDTQDSQTASITRDDNLEGVDRVRLSIDVDRDLMTAMQLHVTDSGRTHDSVDANPAWQPTWYVDTKRDEHHVNFEMAILRRDLVDLPLHAGESWFVSAKPISADADADQTVLPLPNDWVRVIFEP